MSGPVRKTINLAGGEVSYLEWENSGLALHFAHANGFNAETYRVLLQPLASRFHIFAIDMRGHGFTTLPADPDGAEGWATYADDLVQFLNAVCPEPLILAGHSMGAVISLEMAAAVPARVRGLVLVEPVLVPEQGGQPLGKWPGPNLAEMAARRRAVFPSFKAALDAYRGRGAFKTWPDEVIADYLRGGLAPVPGGGEVTLACKPQWEAKNFSNPPRGAAKLVEVVQCPVMVLHAEHGTAPQSEFDIIMRLRPSARVVCVPDASHFLPMEYPEIVRAEIVRAEIRRIAEGVLLQGARLSESSTISGIASAEPTSNPT
jgi:pimeloyl-ACP methyl ester carboxylesterase